MTIEQMMLQSEALIFGSDKPLHRSEIERLLGEMAGEEGLDTEKLTAALDAVVDKYSSDFYPFELKVALLKMQDQNQQHLYQF